MSFQRVRVLFTLALVSSAATLSAQTAPPHNAGGLTERATSLVVLRNGEILQGHVQTAKNDRVIVRMPRGEISIRQAEVDVIAGSLDDAYALKLAKIPPTDVEGHLDLATWCVRHGLLGSAATELVTAISIQPRHPRIAIVQRRLRQTIEQEQAALEPEVANQSEVKPEIEPEPIPVQASAAQEHHEAPGSAPWPPRKPDSAVVSRGSASATSIPAETDNGEPRKTPATKRAVSSDTITEIERLVRTLPTEAVESFTSVAQPILVNGCATAGCHAPGNATTFTLLRLPQDRRVSRRLTQRNLYNVVQLVDFKTPAESTLFTMVKEPHGPLKTPALGQTQSAAYRELVGWVAALTRSNLDAMLPEPTAHEQPAIAEARPPANGSRQPLMRRLRAPSVRASRTPRAPAIQPSAEQAGLIVGTLPEASPLDEAVAKPQANGLTAAGPPLPAAHVSPENQTAEATPQMPNARTPGPNGITAVDRFLALQGAPRVAKELQPPKPQAAAKATATQPPASSEPDPYDLMRFVKDK